MINRFDMEGTGSKKAYRRFCDLIKASLASSGTLPSMDRGSLGYEFSQKFWDVKS